jgi:hypothetical protein
MTGIKRPEYLFVPGFLLVVLTIFLSAYCMPSFIGVPIAGVLVLGLLTAASLLHPDFVDGLTTDEVGRPLLHVLFWGVMGLIGIIFAYNYIPSDWGMQVSFVRAPLTWLQVSYIVLQQVLYFGVHAFIWREKTSS